MWKVVVPLLYILGIPERNTVEGCVFHTGGRTRCVKRVTVLWIGSLYGDGPPHCHLASRAYAIETKTHVRVYEEELERSEQLGALEGW
jgi:hypothetical protein